MSLKRAWHELIGKPQPETKITTGGTTQDYFSKQGRNKERLDKFKTIYDQGGIVAETIDCYPLYMLSSGWRLEGEDRPKQQVQDFIDSIDFETILYTGILDTVVLGDAFQENVFQVGGEFDDIKLRDSSTFEILYDKNDTGEIIGYAQTIDINGVESKIYVDPEQITHLKFIGLGGSTYGSSIIGRAFDEIMRDAKVAESSSVAIERHGFRKYHIKVGLEGEDIPQEVLTNIDREFQKLKTNNEMVTSHDVDIGSIDAGGLDKIDTYSDISMTRLAAGMGVPAELVGTRRLPGNVKVDKRIDSFFRKLYLYQRKVSRCYELSVFDQITDQPGAVKLVFNDISPHDEGEKAEWISKVMAATPLDPFIVLPQTWIKDQFNIDPDTYKDEEDYIPEVESVVEVTEEPETEEEVES